MKTTTFAVLASVISLFASGCGFGQGEGNKYEGLYKASGNATFTINGSSKPATQPTTGHRTVAEGIASDLVYADDDCAYNADINGEVATILPGSSCTLTGNGATQTTTITSGTMQLAENVIIVTVSGTGTATGPGGSLGFTFSYTETLMKVSKAN